MNDYSEYILAAKAALQKAESYALGGRWAEMGRCCFEAGVNAEKVEKWAYCRVIEDDIKRKQAIEDARPTIYAHIRG